MDIDTMTLYNEFTSAANPLIEHFSVCEKSPLLKRHAVFHAVNYESCHHPLLEHCKNNRGPYFSCITYRAHVSCVKRHVCNIFPVFLGSQLDRDLLKAVANIDVTHECDVTGCPECSRSERALEVMSDLYGTIFVISPQYFSNVFTNRKEFIHATRDKTTICELYVYDTDDRGHRFTLLNDDRVCVYRNSSGIEIRMDEPREKVKAFMQQATFNIEWRHLNFDKMYEAFARCMQNIFNIDSLVNKNIMSPINILERVIIHSQRYPEQVQKFLRFGSLDKFASKNIDYESKGNQFVTSNRLMNTNEGGNIPSESVGVVADAANKKKCKSGGGDDKKTRTTTTTTNTTRVPASFFNSSNYENLSFNYKKLQPNQLNCMTYMWDRCVVRPIPKNVSNIPIETEFYLCLAEKTMSIDAPNRWMTLLPHVHISNKLSHAKYSNVSDLNELLDELHSNGYIQESSAEVGQVIILTNGGMPTKYICNDAISRQDFFTFCKVLCPFVECYFGDDICMLNLLSAIPFLQVDMSKLEFFNQSLSRLNLQNKLNIRGTQSGMVFISPMELKSSFIESLRPHLYEGLLGPNCPEATKKYIQHISPSKLISIVYMRNRFISAHHAKRYFDLTVENACIFFDDVLRCTPPPAQIQATAMQDEEHRRDSVTNIRAAHKRRCLTTTDTEPLLKRTKCTKDNNNNNNGNALSLFNHKSSTANMRTIYSANPQLTADGYILSDTIAVNTTLMQRCRLEFDYQLDCDNLIWNEKLPTMGNTSGVGINSFDAYGNCIRKTYLVLRIERFNTQRLRYKFFPQVKLFVSETQQSYGWSYDIYKYYDERCFLEDGADYKMTVISTVPLNRRKVKNFCLIIQSECKLPNGYDGMKLSEQCGQKGLVVVKDTSVFQKIFRLPYKPEVVTSIFSIIGRMPLIAFKCMRVMQDEKEEAIRQRVLTSTYPYVFLKNIAANVCSRGRMRVDLGLCKTMIVNNCNRAMHQLQQDSYESRGHLLPNASVRALGALGIIKINTIFSDNFSHEYNIFENTFYNETTLK